VETIDQSMFWVGRVLRQFFDKGLIVEPVDLFEFTCGFGDLKFQGQ
jgi:hypothetical protein